MTRLDGRVIAVAGAGGGLGPSVLRRLAGAGAVLAATDRDGERLRALQDELGLGPDRWSAEPVDLLDPRAAQAWADRLVGSFGRVDAVAHLVGGWRGGKGIGEADPADWDFLHDLLVRTVQNTSRAFLAALKSSGRGRFVLVSAVQAQRPTATNAAYAAAKAAAEAWTLALADELAGHEATANIVVVNAILTPEMRAQDPGKPFKSFTPAESIADAIAWLFSDAAARMNGQRLSLHP